MKKITKFKKQYDQIVEVPDILKTSYYLNRLVFKSNGKYGQIWSELTVYRDSANHSLTFFDSDSDNFYITIYDFDSIERADKKIKDIELFLSGAISYIELREKYRPT